MSFLAPDHPDYDAVYGDAIDRYTTFGGPAERCESCGDPDPGVTWDGPNGVECTSCRHARA